MRPKTHLEDDVARYWELQIKYRTESEVEAIRNEMSSWWLSLIETRTLEILTGLGYVKDALPYNYLDKPPASLKAVENNKRIITSILKGGEEQLMDAIVRPIQSEVYERVDAFLIQGEMFLNIEKSKSDKQSQYPFLEKYVSDLKEMKSGESSTFSGKGSRLSNDKGIVPISALIVGFLYRLEYEHSTALSHWSHRN